MRARRKEYCPKIPSSNAALMVALLLNHVPGTQGMSKERLMVLAEETGVSKESMSGDGGFLRRMEWNVPNAQRHQRQVGALSPTPFTLLRTVKGFAIAATRLNKFICISPTLQKPGPTGTRYRIRQRA
ncbi:hypothetical protein ACHAXT_009868 [Thalassiosira profunda]